jgi:hypothetical protein
MTQNTISNIFVRVLLPSFHSQSQVPETEKKSTRGMTLIKKKLSTMNSQIKTTDIDSDQNNKGQDGANEWRPPSPILF